MRHRWLCAALIGLGVTGCGQGADDAAPVRKTIEVENPFQDRLMGLSVLNRSLGLRRAIQDAGESCPRITASAYQGRHQQLHMWIGRCEPKRDYAIFIAPNGDAQVRKCSDAATLNLPECKIDSLESVPRISAG